MTNKGARVIKFKVRLKHAWNLILSVALGILGITSFYAWVSIALDLELVRSRVLVQEHQLTDTSRALAVAEGRLASTVRDVDLLSDQIEITLDLLVVADRGGWWSGEVHNTLARLQRLKKERDTVSWIYQ